MATRYIQKKCCVTLYDPPCLQIFLLESSQGMDARLQPGRSTNFLTVHLCAGAFALGCEQAAQVSLEWLSMEPALPRKENTHVGQKAKALNPFPKVSIL